MLRFQDAVGVADYAAEAPASTESAVGAQDAWQSELGSHRYFEEEDRDSEEQQKYKVRERH